MTGDSGCAVRCRQLEDERLPRGHAGARRGVFETTDGAVVMVGAFRENPLQDICRALGLDDLSADPQYTTLEQQKAHRPELQKIFRERFAGNTTA